ncbi:MAG: iron-sulfur cluster repair di-iron protein [Acidobacteriota bacterium]
MFNAQGKTVREIALEMPVTTRVFEEFKIDYCCHGDTPFDEACMNVGASPDVVIQKIDSLVDASYGGDVKSFAEVPLGELIDHVLDKHHIYTKDEMGHLIPLMAKVASRHGDHYQYLLELKELFEAVCEDLQPHMLKEEMVLFPYIRELEYKYLNKMSAAFPAFGTVRHPISMMTVEHEEVGELLSKMRVVTNDYALPDGACPSFTALYHRLGEFERDIHQHIHLENNILFPRAVELEQKAFAPALV